MKLTVLILIVVSFWLHGSVCVYAKEPKVQEVGNKTCPLSGDKVKGKDFIEYNGKRYGVCCAMCEKEFLKNPEKYAQSFKSN